jgi:hypothetical protein
MSYFYRYLDCPGSDHFIRQNLIESPRPLRAVEVDLQINHQDEFYLSKQFT